MSPQGHGDGSASGTRRHLLVALLAAFVSALGGNLTRWATEVNEGAVARAFTPVIFFVAVLYTARHITHLDSDYTKRRSVLGRVMYAMMIIEAALSVALLATGPVLWALSVSPHRRGVLEFDWVSVLVIVVLVHALVVSLLVDRLELTRGSENAHKCRAVKSVNRLARKLHLTGVVRVFAAETDLSELSTLILCIVTVLICTSIANFPAVEPAVYRVLSAGPAASQAKKSSGDSKKEAGGKKKEAGGKKSAGSAKAGTSSTRTSKTPKPVVVTTPPPPYWKLCGTPGRASELGPGVPKEQRQALFQQWLGEKTGLGAVLAGCISPAFQVGASETWVAEGLCYRQFRSLAVASTHGGTIILWKPARFALAEARAGHLVSVTSDEPVGSGDLYTVTSTLGTTVFVRERSSDGSELAGVPQNCAQVHEDPVPYVPVPPALSRLWLEREEHKDEPWLWPALDPTHPDGRHFIFTSAEASDHRRITGYCATSIACTLTVGDVTVSTSGAGAIDAAKLLELAPAAPAAEKSPNG